MGLREQIQQADDFQISDPIPCPEWGADCVLYVKGISGAERDSFEEACFIKRGKRRELSLQDVRAKLIVLAACEKDGKPVFRPGDEKWLTRKSGKVLDRLFSVAQKINGITEEDIEEIAGNSASVPNGDSGSN